MHIGIIRGDHHKNHEAADDSGQSYRQHFPKGNGDKHLTEDRAESLGGFCPAGNILQFGLDGIAVHGIRIIFAGKRFINAGPPDLIRQSLKFLGDFLAGFCKLAAADHIGHYHL